eukprot:894226-Rhodomonas_salina.2
MVLRACYAMRGNEKVYGATRLVQDAWYKMCDTDCRYEMRSTEMANGATLRGAEIGYGGRSYNVLLGTEIARGATLLQLSGTEKGYGGALITR